MLKVAIVGCGRIADQHVLQIRRIPGASIVAACDRERLMARQLRERFGIAADYDDAEAMLAAERPDVVHVTTPPESHLPLAMLCIGAGSHVYVEKPFTVDLPQARQLIETAQAHGRRVTVGHNVQFTRPALEMRRLVAQGYLGGPPVHMESCYGYDLGDIRYVKPMLGDPAHWVRRLPGGLFHNIISHGIGRIAEYFPATEPEIVPLAFTSAPLARTGTGIADELRVMFLDRQSGATAYFTFSTQMRPLLHQFRLYGARNGLVVDDDSRVLLELTGRRRKSYLEQFLPPLGFARQYVRWAIRNGLDFARRELHNDMGMKNLIEAFYRSIVDGGPPPIPYDEILTTARLMDQIFHLVFGAAERRVSGTMQVA